MKLKILSGNLKGKGINVPPTDSVRPILTRLRKSLLDIIRTDLINASFLDLFGGSGIVTFEMISNGARSSTIIELNRLNFQVIKDNARLLGISSRVEIIPGDALKKIMELHSLKRTYDIIYIAPPQYRGLIDRTLHQLSKNRIYHPQSLIITQHHPKEKICYPSEEFYLLKSRQHGNTIFNFYGADKKPNH